MYGRVAVNYIGKPVSLSHDVKKKWKMEIMLHNVLFSSKMKDVRAKYRAASSRAHGRHCEKQNIVEQNKLLILHFSVMLV